MTIYTGKVSEKKEDEAFLFPEVVCDALQSHRENQQNDALNVPPTMITMSGRRRRGNCYNFCILMIALSFVVVGVFGGIFLYKHLAQRKFRGWCSVKYYEYQNVEPEAQPVHSHARGRGRHGHQFHEQKFVGEFEEFVEIDRTSWMYEKIEVPEVQDSRLATVLHDFGENITAIVDMELERCFLMPLNRSNVLPPKDLWDLLNKIESGYYLPDVELLREDYQIVRPPMQNLRKFGFNVWRECHRFLTYRLRKSQPDDPIAMVKRSASAQDNVYSIAGSKNLVKMRIHGL